MLPDKSQLCATEMAWILGVPLAILLDLSRSAAKEILPVVPVTDQADRGKAGQFMTLSKH